MRNIPTPRPLRPCSVADCGEMVNRSLLMCLTHWWQVPRELKDKVLDAYERWMLGDGPPALLFGQLQAAQEEATRAVEAQEGGVS